MKFLIDYYLLFAHKILLGIIGKHPLTSEDLEALLAGCERQS